jgi:predicted nucleotidyltransferase component of viral defense system
VTEASPLRLHEDPALFREAVNFTAAETGFAPRLIEKDYFCSALLQHLEASGAALVFKGGTCLAKVHAGFYRLSEDLDFLVPMPTDASRAARRLRAAAAKRAVAGVRGALPGVHLVAPLTGANDSRQYVAVIGYRTLVSVNEETIKLEVGLREPLLSEAVRTGANTLLLDPVSGSPVVSPMAVTCLSRPEAWAEKLRAALSRRDVAIRDFYDVDHAVRRLGLRLLDPDLKDLVRRKLAVPGNTPVDASPARLAALRQQLEPELRPVLRDRDFGEFDLDRAFALVAELAAALEAGG